MNFVVRFSYLIISVLIIGIVPSYSVAQTIEWSRALGISNSDGTVDFDPLGSIVASGVTPPPYPLLARVAKFDTLGNQLWVKNLGDAQNASAAADSAGNVLAVKYDAGLTVSKLSPQGDSLWSYVPATADLIAGGTVDVDSQGNFLFAGSGEGLGPVPAVDVFVSKVDASGGPLWRTRFGTKSFEAPRALAADAEGNVYITGFTQGDLDGDKGGGDNDLFVSKLNSAGEVQWHRQFGLYGSDDGFAVSVDDLGNVFVAGQTDDAVGGTHLGQSDALALKLDSQGTLQWMKQFGTAQNDALYGIAADGHGNAFVIGSTLGSFGGPNAGGSDAFVAKLTSTGDLAWTLQLGTSANESGSAIAADGLGSIAVLVNGSVTKLRDVPEPKSLAVMSGLSLAICWVSRQRRQPASHRQ